LTNFYLGLARGPIEHKASSVINLTANGAIGMGSAVVLLSSISSSELLPRVTESTAANEDSYGIAVGGDTDGIYATDGAVPSDDTTRATSAAGEGVVVCTQGRCLARVNGNALAISIGDTLTASASPGILEKTGATSDHIVARALQPSTGATDIIAIDVQQEGLNT